MPAPPGAGSDPSGFGAGSGGGSQGDPPTGGLGGPPNRAPWQDEEGNWYFMSEIGGQRIPMAFDPYGGSIMPGGSDGPQVPNVGPYYESAARMALQGTMAGIAAQQAMLDQTLDWYREQYYTTRNDMMPWIEAGSWAIKEWRDLIDEGGQYFPTPEVGAKAAATARKNAPTWADSVYQNNQYEKSPYYNFLKQEGVDAMDRSASAQGMLMSGPQQKAITEYGQNFASTDVNNWLSQYYQKANLASGQRANQMSQFSQMAGQGQTQSANLGAIGAQYAGNAGNAMMTAGTNTANMLQSGYSDAAGLRATGQVSDAMNQYQHDMNMQTQQREWDMWNTYNQQREDSGGMSFAQGVIGGAAAGTAISPGWGTVIGGFLGGISTLFG